MAGAIAGFETNDLSEFTGTSIGANAALTASTDRANSGTHSMKLAFDGGGSTANNVSYGYWTISKTELYLRTYIYVDTLSVPAWDAQEIIFVRNGAFNCLFRIKISDYSATGSPKYWSAEGTGLTADSIEDDNIVGNWHRVEVHWKAGTGADGGLEMRVNGLTIFSDMNNDLSAYTMETIQIGIPDCSFVPAAGSLLYFDDCGWSDADWLGEIAVAGLSIPVAEQNMRGNFRKMRGGFIN